MTDNKEGQRGTLMGLEARRSRREEAESVRDMQYVRLNLVTLGDDGEMNKVKAVIAYFRTQESTDGREEVTGRIPGILAVSSGLASVGYPLMEGMHGGSYLL